MRKHCVLEKALLVLVLGLCSASHVFAYVNPPEFLPQPLAPGENVSMLLSFGDCDVFVEYPPEPTAFPRITREGQTIRVELFGFHYEDGFSCTVTPRTRTYELGAYPAGDYLVEIVRVFENAAGFTYTPVSTTPIRIGVNGTATPTSLPIGNPISLGILTLLVGIIGFIGRKSITRPLAPSP